MCIYIYIYEYTPRDPDCTGGFAVILIIDKMRICHIYIYIYP